MNIISNSTNDKTSIIITISVDTNIIKPAVYHFLTERNIRFEVFWPQLCSLE